MKSFIKELVEHLNAEQEPQEVVHLLQIEAQQCSFARVLCQSQINDLCWEILATQTAGDPPTSHRTLLRPVPQKRDAMASSAFNCEL